jgi:nucleoid-associated protein YgaU
VKANTCSSGSQTRPQPRSRVRWDRVALLIALVAGTVGVVGRAAADGPGEDMTRYVVRAGDTLWDLARARVGFEGDPRPLVADIREANELGTRVLRAGEVLMLPAP